jgi:hypothetical protein
VFIGYFLALPGGHNIPIGIRYARCRPLLSLEVLGPTPHHSLRFVAYFKMTCSTKEYIRPVIRLFHSIDVIILVWLLNTRKVTGQHDNPSWLRTDGPLCNGSHL